MPRHCQPIETQARDLALQRLANSLVHPAKVRQEPANVCGDFFIPKRQGASVHNFSESTELAKANTEYKIHIGMIPVGSKVDCSGKVTQQTSPSSSCTPSSLCFHPGKAVRLSFSERKSSITYGKFGDYGKRAFHRWTVEKRIPHQLSWPVSQ